MSSRHDETVLDLENVPVLRFRVDGVPVPQGSKAIVTIKGKGEKAGRARLIESADKATKTHKKNRLKNWRDRVHAAGARARLEAGLELLNEDLVIGFLFVLPRPISHFTKSTRDKPKGDRKLTAKARRDCAFPGVKPDLSKLIRGVEDGLEGAVFVNDSRIIGYRDPFKVYDDDQGAGVSVEVWRIDR